MKTEEQIKAKIDEHEKHINEILEMNRAEWTEDTIIQIDSYLVGRKALMWVLSEEYLIKADTYEKLVNYECLCFDSAKIF